MSKGYILFIGLFLFSCQKAYKIQINYCEEAKKDTVWVRDITTPRPYKRKFSNIPMLEANGKIYTGVCYINVLEIKK